MHIIYIDDESPALDNFRYTAEKIPEITSLEMLQDGYEALEFIKKNMADVVFLDMSMPEIHGLELAKEIKKYDPNIRIVLRISASKPRELFALLVDRGDSGITTSEAIACLWPERPDNTNTQSLLRMTYKRLVDTLEDRGAGHIVASDGNISSNPNPIKLGIEASVIFVILSNPSKLNTVNGVNELFRFKFCTYFIALKSIGVSSLNG